jgi:hypothetical protein
MRLKPKAIVGKRANALLLDTMRASFSNGEPTTASPKGAAHEAWYS